MFTHVSCVLQVAPELHTTPPFSHIQFSADGKLMLCVAEGHIYQLDAFNGTLLQTYNTGVPAGSPGLGAIFSPDSNYILSGISVPASNVIIVCVYDLLTVTIQLWLHV